MFEAIVETIRGYRIEEVLQEFWDELAPEYVLSGWGLVVVTTRATPQAG